MAGFACPPSPTEEDACAALNDPTRVVLSEKASDAREASEARSSAVADAAMDCRCAIARVRSTFTTMEAFSLEACEADVAAIPLDVVLPGDADEEDADAVTGRPWAEEVSPEWDRAWADEVLCVDPLAAGVPEKEDWACDDPLRLAVPLLGEGVGDGPAAGELAEDADEALCDEDEVEVELGAEPFEVEEPDGEGVDAAAPVDEEAEADDGVCADPL